MRYNSSDDDPHPVAHSQRAMLDATSACPRRRRGGACDRAACRNRSSLRPRFDPAEGFTREQAERSVAFLIDQPYAWVIDVGGFKT
jgi:hypothetical protein